MQTFKQFLLEGGAATAKYDTQRASKTDIETTLSKLRPIIGDDPALLGSAVNTLAGNRETSGDIDIALSIDEFDPSEIHEKMMVLTNKQGSLNKGTNIGSYALKVSPTKKVQVDLMYVNSVDWAKFIYFSADGNGSKYPGVVRNLLLQAVARNTHEPGKDFVILKNDEVIARASRAIKLNVGLERLFKAARKKKNGDWNKSLDKVDPQELKVIANELAGKDIPFSPEADIIDDPDKVAAWLFGSQVKADDIKTAEQVIERIIKLKSADKIFKDARLSLKKNGVQIPSELP